MKTNTSDWLSLDHITGWLTGIPSVNDIGTYWINISVTDGESGSDYQNFTLKVLNQPIKKNKAPELSNVTIVPLNGNIETSFTFSIHYYDANNDTPTIIQVIIDYIPRNLILKHGENISNGIYYYNTTLSEGKHIYYFIASDGLETVRTGNYSTSKIQNENKNLQNITIWYWVIFIIIVIIIISILFIFIYNKRKVEKIPVVRAELMQVIPKHISLNRDKPEVSTTQSITPKVFDQLPTPQNQTQPAFHNQDKQVPVLPSKTSHSPAPIQYQLPQATLSKEQRLGLLNERFLRGEVTEDTYKELKAEIEGKPGMGITDEDKKIESSNQMLKSSENTEKQPTEITKETNLHYSNEGQINKSS